MREVAAGESSERTAQKSSEIGSLNCEFFNLFTKRKNVKIKAEEKIFLESEHEKAAIMVLM